MIFPHSSTFLTFSNCSIYFGVAIYYNVYSQFNLLFAGYDEYDGGPTLALLSQT